MPSGWFSRNFEIRIISPKDVFAPRELWSNGSISKIFPRFRSEWFCYVREVSSTMEKSAPLFTFVDLFAGIGGFHAAMTAAGGECVYAIEKDPRAASIYDANWGINPAGDITVIANEEQMKIPPHDVLCAGFPCQPFSKSGAQRGMDETRGTLYWNILQIIEKRRPSIVLLENVRNLTGPRHRHEWQIILETLRNHRYRVSDTPTLLSPHRIPPAFGGRPQARERVFIAATRVPKVHDSLEAEALEFPSEFRKWDITEWDLASDLPLDVGVPSDKYALSSSEHRWIDAWDDFVQMMKRERRGGRLPGFPLWADNWEAVDNRRLAKEPKWKADFLRKNSEFYFSHKRVIDQWTKRWGIYTDDFPPSRRKLEWQAQDIGSLWETVLHFRPSGIRAKAPNYLPALVAMNQTSVLGSLQRKISIREAARLQGLPEWFDFGNQPNSFTYKQLGNGVSVGVVWNVFKSQVNRDQDLLNQKMGPFAEAILGLPDSPDPILGNVSYRSIKNFDL